MADRRPGRQVEQTRDQLRDLVWRRGLHVVAKTPDGRTLRSAELMYDSRQQTIASDKPFTFDRAGQHLEGNAFVSDPDFRNVTAQQPRGGETRPGGGGGGGFLLPGQ